MDRSTFDGWLLTIVTLLLWGSIGTLAKASKVKWATFYSYYACGIVVAASLLGASLDFATVFAEARRASGGALFYASLAGVCGCVGSMLFLSSIELIGVTLSYPVVMGLEMTLGTVLLYLADPQDLSAGYLAAALVAFLAAVALDALAQLQLTLDEEAAARAGAVVAEPAPAKGEGDALIKGLVPPPPLSFRHRSTSLGKLDFVVEDAEEADVPFDSGDDDSDAEAGDFVTMPLSPHLARAHPVDVLASNRLLETPASPRSPRVDKSAKKVVRRGLRRAAAAGLLLSLWPVLETLALEEDDGLSVFTFMVLFGLSHSVAVVVAVPVRSLYLKRPSSKSSPAEPMAGVCGRACACGLAAGAFWYSGAVFVFVAGTKIGVTVAVSVGRCSPVVAALWGILVWREAQHAKHRASLYIAAMFACYVVGIVLIACSAR